MLRRVNGARLRAPVTTALSPRRIAAGGSSALDADSDAPLIIEGATVSWDAAACWSPALLKERFPTETFAVATDGGDEITIADAFDSRDYLFDDCFSRFPALAREYTPPPPFPTAPEADYVFHQTSFSALRPAARWLLICAEGKGVGIHVDPRGTSAWNALLFGRKRWALLPPTTPLSVALAGARTLESDEAALLSAAAWFHTCAPALRSNATAGLVEFVQEAGEIVFIPRGWWHVALAEAPECVGVTHNFLTQAGFEHDVLKLCESAGGAQAARAWLARVLDAGLRVDECVRARVLNS